MVASILVCCAACGSGLFYGLLVCMRFRVLWLVGFSLVVAFRSSWDGQVLRGWCGLRLLGALRGLLRVVAVCCGFWGFAIWADCVFRSCVGLV